MAILGKLLQQGIKMRKSIEQANNSPLDLQREELYELLSKSRKTQFGRKYKFNLILEKIINEHDGKGFYTVFKNQIPVYNYNKIFNEWWHKTLKGEKDVCWPGPVKYFALSSGTSEASTKHIPITREMIKAIRKTGIRQILTLSDYDLSPDLFTKGILMLGGSTHLNYSGHYFEGDLSGITAGQIPFWFQIFYKPGKKIAKFKDWNMKLDEITINAHKWDIGIIVGVPAWIQILMEKIIAYYKVKHIHEIWPNLQIYVHGGVSFDPYKKGFEKLLGKPITYIETYLASEGFIAYQAVPNKKSMRLVLNNGIFFEFVPFNETNFQSDGEIVEKPETLMIDDVEEGKEYALLLTTCAGTWRYLLGDVIKFVSKKDSEIVITGRTKHFLSLCGEHLSVDNMNKAVELVSNELNISIKEFTVAGIPYETLFAHKWYIGTDDQVDAEKLKNLIDDKLSELNDDYRVERTAALKEVFVKILPTQTFYQWMKLKGKEGGQNKFPRVLKKSQIDEWEKYIQENSLISK
jgi:hypothetical protein